MPPWRHTCNRLALLESKLLRPCAYSTALRARCIKTADSCTHRAVAEESCQPTRRAVSGAPAARVHGPQHPWQLTGSEGRVCHRSYHPCFNCLKLNRIP